MSVRRRRFTLRDDVCGRSALPKRYVNHDRCRWFHRCMDGWYAWSTLAKPASLDETVQWPQFSLAGCFCTPLSIRRLQSSRMTRQGIYTLFQKNFPHLACYNFNTHMNRFWQFSADMLLRKCAVIDTSALALPWDKGNPEIASFHLNYACCFASKPTKHIQVITWP